MSYFTETLMKKLAKHQIFESIWGHGDTNKILGRVFFKSFHSPSDQWMSASLQQEPSAGEFLSSSQVACLQLPWVAPLLRWWRPVNRAELAQTLLGTFWIFGSLPPTNQTLPRFTASSAQVCVFTQGFDIWQLGQEDWSPLHLNGFQNATRVPVYTWNMFSLLDASCILYTTSCKLGTFPWSYINLDVSRAGCSTCLACPHPPRPQHA